MRIALAGNPNSGKTTMYNVITGRNEKVGNWAGVTVEKKESPLKKSLYEHNTEIIAVDLPGAYSMSPFTSEESVTRDYIYNERPDVIINIVDATNLSRSLFFTTQLLELGIPMVIALNKSDINQKKQTKIDTTTLSKLLNCPVMETISTSSSGVKDLVKIAISLYGKQQKAPYLQGYVDFGDKNAVLIADKKRFEFVNQVVKTVESRKTFTRVRNSQDKIDDIITNKWVGLPIFALVMFLVFQISQAWLGPWVAEILVGIIETIQGYVTEWVQGATPILQSLVVDGIVGGVGAVLGFLPLVMVMYFLIALLEDCGYMARATVVLDPIFKKVGLSGKSVIPFVIGTGCAIPGVMACRTIRNERERRATAMLAPFMPCGAKLPVISLFAGVFFHDAAWVGTVMYFAGIFIILVGALIVNRITGNSKKKSYFIIELPEYKLPSIKRAFFSMCSRGWSYIVKAGTVILLCNTAVQIMQSFNWKFDVINEGADTSILASIANPISYLLVPIVGIKAWQLAAAAVTGFIAKENVVGTLAVCYSITNFIDTEELALTGGAGEVAATIGLTNVAALAYLMFNLFTPPCFAAIGAMRSEMKSGKWMLGGISLQLATGFTVAYLVYTIGTLLTDASLLNINYALAGLVAVLVFAFVIGVLCVRGDRKVQKSKINKKEKIAVK